MIAYQDFVPRITDRGGLFKQAQFDTLRTSLLEANRWIRERNIRVLNLETVVLPNVHASWEEGSEDASLRTSGEMSTTWHQFIRVWYDLQDGPPPLALPNPQP